MSTIYRETESFPKSSPDTVKHYRRPAERSFLRSQRESTTVLFGGLTWKHERLIQASAKALGYHFKPLPVPSVSAFQTGKEFGNNGQCNPTYFTVGNLVEYLQNLQAQGKSHEEICSRYIFLTAGACGPCRFGMYEAEYRLALENAGFADFRVLLFQQKGGIRQSDSNTGLAINAPFLLGLLNAFVLGDMLNELAYQIRPYELNPGETNRVLKTSIEQIASHIEMTQVLSTPFFKPWVHYLTDRSTLKVLNKCYQQFRQIPVNPLQVKPVVKVTGEFWAQTTEGDGNYRMFEFLEAEGAQVLVEPIGTWITYMLHQSKQKLRDRQNISKPYLFLKNLQSLFILTLAEKLFSRHWNRCRKALGNAPHPLLNQYHLQKLGHPYYHSRAQGGEGHLEVAKNIYYSQNNMAHMVLSLKPFGCMPSTQSDGVQSAVVNAYPEMIFLPVETSGEGEINARSRVQMSLSEASDKAHTEFTLIKNQCHHSFEEIQAYLKDRPELNQTVLQDAADNPPCSSAAKVLQYLDTTMCKVR